MKETQSRAAGEPAFGVGNAATGGSFTVRVSHGHSPRGLIVALFSGERKKGQPMCPRKKQRITLRQVAEEKIFPTCSRAMRKYVIIAIAAFEKFLGREACWDDEALIDGWLAQERHRVKESTLAQYANDVDRIFQAGRSPSLAAVPPNGIPGLPDTAYAFHYRPL